MNWKINLIISLLVLQGCAADTGVKQLPVVEGHLIEAAEAFDIRNRQHIKFVDFRKDKAFSEGHIEGAVQIWRTDIEDASYPYKGMMASQEQLEALLGGAGIHTNDTIIIYDDRGLCNAARLWWVLQNHDHNQVLLMEGGLDAWQMAGGKAVTSPTNTQAADFHLSDSPSMKFLVAKEDVQEAIADGVLIVDTRTSDEFSGKRLKDGASKAGRIPTSLHLDWAAAIDYEGDQRIRPESELNTIFSRLEIEKDERVILYCHSGVRSAHTTFVMTQLLGYNNVKNYDGSWNEWSYFEELPYENDIAQTLN